MTAPERIWAWAWQTMPMGQWGVNPSPSSVEYIRADLAAVPAQVRVKPLVWEVFQSKYEGRQHYGRGVFGHWYGVSRQKSVAWNCFHFIDGRRVDLGTHPTIDAAKVAAQADYEARILAAIEPQPDPRDEAIARLVEALEWMCSEYDDGGDGFDARTSARAALAAAKAVHHD